jgi:hypothetical protein
VQMADREFNHQNLPLREQSQLRAIANIKGVDNLSHLRLVTGNNKNLVNSRSLVAVNKSRNPVRPHNGPRQKRSSR